MKISMFLFVISFAFGVNANGQEEVYGKILMKNFPPAQKPIDFGSVRNGKQLNVSDVVRKSDLFLEGAFGDVDKPKIFSVCYRTVRVEGGKIWCWTVGYYHPESGDFDNHRIFYVYLSSKGEPLMKVEEQEKEVRPKK